jgi:hypothetical protein
MRVLAFFIQDVAKLGPGYGLVLNVSECASAENQVAR